MKAYESFSEWKKAQSTRNQKFISQLERVVKKAAPHLTTFVKWGQGCWIEGVQPKMYIHAEDDHVQFGFYNGSSLKDPHGLLSGNGKYVRFVKILSAKDIDQKRFTALIAQVVKKPM